MVLDVMNKSSFTLLDLLRTRDILDEIKIPNEDLIQFFSTDENIRNLINYSLIQEGFEISRSKRKNLYYASNCSEILTLKADAFSRLFQANGATYIGILLSYLERPTVCELVSSNYSRLMLLMIKFVPDLLRSRLDRTHFEGCVKHMYCFGMVETLRNLLDLPHDGSSRSDTLLLLPHALATQYWWGKTDDALKLIINQISKADLDPLYYENLKEFVISLIYRGSTIGSDSALPPANALLTALCQSQNVISLIRIAKDLANQHRSAAVLAILERLFLRTKQVEDAGLGGYEMVTNLPRIGVDERGNIGIVPIRTLDKILGTFVENCHFLKSMIRGYMRHLVPVVPNIGLETEAGKGLLAVSSIIRVLTETNEQHIIQALSYNSVYTEFLNATLKCSFSPLFVNNFLGTMIVLIDSSAFPSMKYFFDESQFFKIIQDTFTKNKPLKVSQPLMAVFSAVAVHIYRECGIEIDPETGEPPEVLPPTTELGRFLQRYPPWLELLRDNFLSFSCMVLVKKLSGESETDMTAYFEPNNNVRVIPVK